MTSMADILTCHKTLVERFGAVATACADEPFIVLVNDPANPVTFGESYARAQQFAALFASRGVRSRDVIAVLLPTHRDAAAVFFGAMIIGAIPSFFPPLSPKQDATIFWASHGALFARIDVALIVTDDFNIPLIIEHLPAYAHRCVDIEADLPGPDRTLQIAADRRDIAFLQHSSGTTGLKKGVALTHGMVLDHIDAMVDCLAITERDVIASWLPIYHDMGLIACFVAPALLGIPVVTLDPFAWVRRPASLLDAIADFGATLCWLPNFAFHHIMRMADPRATYDLSSLRAIIDCSEPCKPSTLDAFRVHFAAHGLNPIAPQVSYAMAEAVFLVTQTRLGAMPRSMDVDAETLDRDGTAVIVSDPQSRRAILSCGVPMRGVRLRILDADGAPCPDRQVGAVMVSSDSLFEGYFRLPMPPGKLEAGWYHTGDRGFLDAGELFITGRSDDLLIVHGKNIYAHDVEFCINTHCNVKPGRTVAIAPFNAATGSQSLVVIAETEASDPIVRRALARSIKSAVHAEFAATLYEAMIVPPGWLVKTTSGKLSRAENLARYVAARPAFQAAAS
ncbi:Acyl-CoA synthetase (AMP-forming)/AMP-acid ligase II [Acidiphilium rubrum]|uniref:Acyl-CoA synthetase (AMP-forming)/AMP-acid ligase II n=2 Tax=Acidocellaceae TaxID=3385905 RepID=A0A8G2CIZ5_ACIRU|nr:Acyl-CoA synthetase (AMP-forming)/AMP-acid ligase II [Acidiphilium rubrum]